MNSKPREITRGFELDDIGACSTASPWRAWAGPLLNDTSSAIAKTVTSQRDDPNFDHSSLVYFVDAAGKYVGYSPPGTSADRMVEVIRQ